MRVSVGTNEYRTVLFAIDHDNVIEAEFFATLAEHIAIEPSERFFVELLSQRCAQCAIFFVKNHLPITTP